MKNRRKRDRYVLDPADGNFAITNVKADETKKKERKERRIENGVYFADSDSAVCCIAVFARSVNGENCVEWYDMYAFQMYDAFPIAIKEIMNRANYNNHNVLATLFVTFEIHSALGR